MAELLFLDDLSVVAEEIFKVIPDNQHSLTRIQDPAALGEYLAVEIPDAILVSLAEPAALKPHYQALRDFLDGKKVIYLARDPQVAEAVMLLKGGFADYLEPPITGSKVSAALGQIVKEVLSVPDPAGNARGLAAMIGESAGMKKVFSLIRKVCDSDTTIMVQGESGTGKELIARALHFESGRSGRPFVPVNCGAIPAELLESELFGHEKGAFTNAIRSRKGRFELADGGTVFLDEISEMSPMLQVKLLRVLQEKQFERVGGTRTITSDFRVIAATNRDLEAEVEKGRFRQDLFYRLNVIPIEAPPLRERKSDIPLLVDFFIAKLNHSKNKAVSGVSGDTLDRLINYSWPGNVRELENVVERMVILASGTELGIVDLPERVGAGPATRVVVDTDQLVFPESGICLQDEVVRVEKEMIARALARTNWVKNRAAKLLRVNRTTLLEKMKRYKMVESAESEK